jgi:peptidoglycan hydrolase CwlO-like protein
MDFFDFVPVVSQKGGADVTRIPALIKQRDDLEAQLSRAKTKRTKTSLSRRINDLTRQIDDLQRLKNKMDAAAAAAAAAAAEAEKPKTDVVPGGSESDDVLEKQPIKVASETKADPVLASAQPESTKKPNYLLLAGIGVGVIAIILLIRRR